MTYWPLKAAPDLPVPPKAVAAVRDAALRYAGAVLTEDAAGKIARAVLECADDELRVRQAVDETTWDADQGIIRGNGVRDSVRQHLRIQIFAECAKQDVLPVAWPRERVVRPAGPWQGGLLHVELSVPVRRVIP